MSLRIPAFPLNIWTIETSYSTDAPDEVDGLG